MMPQTQAYKLQPRQKNILLTALIIVSLSVTQVSAMTISAETRAGLVEAVTAIAAGVDRHDWSRVRGAMADTITTDYTSLFGGEPVTQPADELVTQWSNFLTGFDTTHHLVTNHTITAFTDTTATGQADFQATHRIDKALWVLGGRYNYKFVKSGDRWVVTSITMTATWETGDRALVQQASERAKGAN
ncbi:hypothetical protein NKDENANG_03388 [Candidatus Entotheonellaceae bacterium PAL068K]